MQFFRTIILLLSLTLATASVCQAGGKKKDKGEKASFSEFLNDSAKEAKKKNKESKAKKKKRFGRKNKDELKSLVESSAPTTARTDFDSYAIKLSKTLEMLSADQQERIFK